MLKMKIEFNEIEYNKMIEEWNKDNYYIPEKVLERLFFNGKVYKSEKRELERICLLNQFYSTKLFNHELIEMSIFLARNANELNGLINTGSEKAIALIARALKTKEKDGRLCYVFATKYCSFISLDSDNYPIFDNSVGEIYILNRKKWDKGKKIIKDSIFKSPYSDISEQGLIKRYADYKNAVLSMKKEMPWNPTIKELDKYFWMVVHINRIGE